MSGLELLLIPAVLPVVAPVYAYVRGRNQPDDPAEVAQRRAAAAEAEAQEAANTRALVEALRGAEEAHIALTNAWRSAISLFDQEGAYAKGVPAWAIGIILQAKKLTEESAELTNLCDGYDNQIKVAERDANRELRADAWEHVVKLTGRLRSLRQRMYSLLPRLKAARSAYDDPAAAPAAPPSDEEGTEPPLPKRSSSGSVSSGSNNSGSPSVPRTFTPSSLGGGRAVFRRCEGMRLDEDGVVVEALEDNCWAEVDFDMRSGGEVDFEFKWSFEVVDVNFVGGGGAIYGLSSGEGPNRQLVYLHGQSGTCYRTQSRFTRSWATTSEVIAGSVVHFHLCLRRGILLGCVGKDPPVELARDTTLFADKTWRPCVGAEGARPVVRLLACGVHAPEVLTQPVAATGLLAATAQETLAIASTMKKGIDRDRREKPLRKTLRDYSAWHGLSAWM